MTCPTAMMLGMLKAYHYQKDKTPPSMETLMGQIGRHSFTDSDAPLDENTSSVGAHGFGNSDNQSTPCNGTDSCSEDDQDK